MGLLWMLIPDEALLLVLVGVGIAVIIGLLRPAAAIGIFASVVIYAAISPLLETVVSGLPSWLLIVLAIALAISFFKMVMVLIIGSHAASTTVGILAADVVRVLFLAPFRFLRFVGRLFRPGRP